MQRVRVEKKWLNEKVAANRECHRAQYERAFENYRKDCIVALQQNLDEVRKGSRKRIIIGEVPPEDHTSDYDRVMAMLAVSVDDIIELQAEEFECYVLDQWGWKERWTTSNSKYL